MRYKVNGEPIELSTGLRVILTAHQADRRRAALKLIDGGELRSLLPFMRQAPPPLPVGPSEYLIETGIRLKAGEEFGIAAGQNPDQVLGKRILSILTPLDEAAQEHATAPRKVKVPVNVTRRREQAQAKGPKAPDPVTEAGGEPAALAPVKGDPPVSANPSIVTDKPRGRRG